MRLVVALAALVALAACPHPAAAPAKKRLVIATTAEPDTLCPALSTSGTAHEVTALLARDLVVAPAGGAPAPDLAEVVPTLANGCARVDGDKLAVTWRIKDSARWEDGAPVTAADFVRGLDAQKSDGAVGHGDAERIESMTPSADGRSFVVVWKEPNPFFAAPRVHRPLPAHSGDLRAYCRKPLSDGPFRLVEWVPGEHLLFARNEHYTPRPALDEVLVKIVPSTSTLLAMLQSGDVDAAFPSGGPSPVEAHDFAAAHPGFVVDSAPGQVWGHIDFNLDDPVLGDVRVRRAIALAIPRAKIVEAMSHGTYAVADGYIPPTHWAHVDNLAPIPFDPAQAKALLAEAHVALPLKLTLSAASGSPESDALLALVQASLRDLGVDVALDTRPFKVFFGEGAKKRKLPHLAFYSWTIDDTSMGGALWRSDRIPTEANGYAGQNLPGFKNEEVTKLLADADRTLEPVARRQMIARVQQIVHDELPAIPLYFRPVVALHAARVTGLAPTGTMTPLAWNASSWDVSR